MPKKIGSVIPIKPRVKSENNGVPLVPTVSGNGQLPISPQKDCAMLESRNGQADQGYPELKNFGEIMEEHGASRTGIKAYLLQLGEILASSGFDIANIHPVVVQTTQKLLKNSGKELRELAVHMNELVDKPDLTKEKKKFYDANRGELHSDLTRFIEENTSFIERMLSRQEERIQTLQTRIREIDAKIKEDEVPGEKKLGAFVNAGYSGACTAPKRYISTFKDEETGQTFGILARV